MSNRTWPWQREDGEPWESVDSLPIPDDPDDARPGASTPPLSGEETDYNGPYPADESSEERDLQQPVEDEFVDSRFGDEDHAEEAEEDWKDEPPMPTQATTTRRPELKNVVPLYDMGYIDLCRPIRPIRPIGPPIRAPYPAALGPPRRRPVPLPIHLPQAGPSHSGHDGHPPIIPLSVVAGQLGISLPVRERDRYGRPRPRSPLSPPPTKPKREDFEIADVEYVVRAGKLYQEEREVVFPKVPTYLPPRVKKHGSPLSGRAIRESRDYHGQGRRHAYRAPDPSRESAQQDTRAGPHELIDPRAWDPEWRVPKGVSVHLLMAEWERTGYVEKKKKRSKHGHSGGTSRHHREYVVRRRHDDDAGEYRRRDGSGGGGISRHFYDTSNGDGKGKAKQASVEDEASDGEPEVRQGKDRNKVRFAHDDDAASRTGDEEDPGWIDVDDHTDIDSGRGRRRHRSVDGQDVDIYESATYHSDDLRPYNIKRIRDRALKTLGAPDKSSRSSKKRDKGKASTSPTDPDADADVDEDNDDADGDVEMSPVKTKKPDKYAAFKATTGKHPRNYHVNRHGEAVERFVLDRRPLAEGEEEPIGEKRRRPMVGVVDLKTGERRRREIRGYEKLPTFIKVASGLAMLNGKLPPRRERETAEEALEDVEPGEGDAGAGDGEAPAPKPKKKTVKGKKKKKKKDGCGVM